MGQTGEKWQPHCYNRWELTVITGTFAHLCGVWSGIYCFTSSYLNAGLAPFECYAGAVYVVYDDGPASRTRFTGVTTQETGKSIGLTQWPYHLLWFRLGENAFRLFSHVPPACCSQSLLLSHWSERRWRKTEWEWAGWRFPGSSEGAASPAIPSIWRATVDSGRPVRQANVFQSVSLCISQSCVLPLWTPRCIAGGHGAATRGLFCSSHQREASSCRYVDKVAFRHLIGAPEWEKVHLVAFQVLPALSRCCSWTKVCVLCIRIRIWGCNAICSWLWLCGHDIICFFCLCSFA